MAVQPANSSNVILNAMPPKKKGGNDKKPTKKAPQPSKPKRQPFENETVRKPHGASHGTVERAGDKLFN